jgi:serine/threonine-protein kinase
MTPTLGVGSVQVSLQDGMEMVYVPGGEFLMGPGMKKVRVDAFWIDRTEITNAMYSRCVEARACPPPSRENYKKPEYANHPVIWVNWFQSLAYCRWAGRRLPTEAEWEKAARGTDGRLYPWGNEDPQNDMVNICDQTCNFKWNDKTIDDGFSQTVPVGSYPKGASPYGALDMSGNVWEWTADWFDETNYYVPQSVNPKGAKYGEKRVIRGGSWTDLFEYIQTTYRSKLVPEYALYNIGFRCAYTPKGGAQ